ncbi:MAG: ATP-dependent DNA helicase [Steroidobacteraceae bacterium]
MHSIEDIFGAGGALADTLSGYRPRSGQLQMAERVALAMQERRALVVEAGTGIGKTFAYLVPALLSGLRVIISTGTRTLQDQLHGKDVPLVAGALGRPARLALLKGRGNYLCRHRLEEYSRQSSLAMAREGSTDVMALERWSMATRTGDLVELAGLADDDPIRPHITSTRDNCLGQRCARFDQCFILQARRAALEADLIVVNHHLLLADMLLKEDGFGDLLGAADVVIVDEAHQLPDLATQFFTVSVGTRQTANLLIDLRGRLAIADFATDDLLDPVRRVEKAELQLRQAAARGATAVDATTIAAADELQRALGVLAEQLQPLRDDEALGQCANRARQLAERLGAVIGLADQDGVRGMEATANQVTLSAIPFDVAGKFNALVAQTQASWIFTSATLAIGADFTAFVSRLGLDDCEALAIPSPFDYEQQALLYLPPKMPDPASDRYLPAVIAETEWLVAAAGGGAFVLFTSHRALSQAASQLRTIWRDESWPVLVQGEAPREVLLERFRAHGNAVLLGTASFWEGVDVRGDALRLVIVEKLPFQSPDEPLVRARIDFLRRSGGNPFADFQLPEAVLTLKQGVGRLIRSESDRGVVALLDPRLRTRGYGRVFIRALPPMARTEQPGDVKHFLRQLTRELHTASGHG